MKKVLLTLLTFYFGSFTVVAQSIDELRASTEKYVDAGENWLESRLQMHWNTHATDIYISGEEFHHIGENRAPAPTVRMDGMRNWVTIYSGLKLEEIVPYQEDPSSILVRKAAEPDSEPEWVHPSKTGFIISYTNLAILQHAVNAAKLYKLTGEEKYARVAAKVFDTYMTGIYYRNVATDINHGHVQTIIGLQTFEVIHESTVSPTTECYVLMRDYLKKNYPDKIAIYEEGFKKWAENIIANGVAHNNWNMMQAAFIVQLGDVLQPNSQYADGKGRDYYINYVINESSIRQWSLKKLAAYGYDPETGIWNECAGYSNGVLRDFVNMVTYFDEHLHIDLIKEIPVILTAVLNSREYHCPDGLTIGFGDTNPSTNPSHIYPAMAKWGVPAEGVEALKWSKLFYAKNASWLVMRTGMDKKNSLQVTLNGSLGNHMHANGISMEFYAKGLRMGPDAGFGRSYNCSEYHEYYVQFLAHNTVSVDGISGYPAMKANHGFTQVEQHEGDGYLYSIADFLEPETMSDQRRTVAVVSTSDTTGYVVDVFRSHRRDGKDKFHDYFYHNLGQEMSLSCRNLQPTEELSFSGGYIEGYSYFYDKFAETTAEDVQASWTIRDERTESDGFQYGTNCTMWMKGSPERTLFKTKCPPTDGLKHLKNMPYNIATSPTHTFVARQQGEAWSRPFVAVFDPEDKDSAMGVQNVSYPETGDSSVKIEVTLRNGAKQSIIVTEEGKFSISKH